MMKKSRAHFSRMLGSVRRRLSFKPAGDSADVALNPHSESLHATALEVAPVIWLIGKTGAGKTSVVATLTGSEHAEVGNGFVPCTRTASLFDYPPDMPLVRFLDTRGLNEPGYEPAEDIAWQQEQAHLMMVIMKVSDPLQDGIVEVVRAVRKTRPEWPLVVVHTGLHELYESPGENHPGHYPFPSPGAQRVDDPAPPDEVAATVPVHRALRNALAYQRRLFADLKGSPPLFVAVDLTRPEDGYDPPDYGKAALIDAVLEAAPEALRLVVRLEFQKAADSRWAGLRSRILYWAASASAVGIAPVVGLATVPAAQAAMLRDLAKCHGVRWRRRDVAALFSILGVAVVAGQGALFAARQLAKIGPWMIPISAIKDYALTYALGRAACVYLRARQNRVEVDSEQVRAVFQASLREAFSVGGEESVGTG